MTAPAPVPPRQAFGAMRHAGFRWFFVTNVMAMMADNIEHVISYWVMFQKFHSPALGEAIRGRVIGLYVMASLGGRAFAGITVGILGALVGVHLSLPLAAAGLALVIAMLLARAPRG